MINLRLQHRIVDRSIREKKQRRYDGHYAHEKEREKKS